MAQLSLFWWYIEKEKSPTSSSSSFVMRDFWKTVKYQLEREREKLAIRGYRSSRHLNSGVKENTHGGIKNQKGQKIEGDQKKKNIRWGIYSPWGGSGGDSRWERNAFVFTWISSYIDALHLRLMFLAFRTNLNFPPCFSLNSLIWSDCIISWTECALVFPLNQVTYSRLLSLFFSKIGSSLWRGSLEKVSWLYSTTISIYRSKVSDRISLGSSGGVHTAGF